ncbi:MAG: hypothetical protein JSW34_02975 [Candidatus Zixiibacteriota bacterium]|nr:MAG: hypothetical protein JSW34_02975 [candidate division Zixibacteria bacterium]
MMYYRRSFVVLLTIVLCLAMLTPAWAGKNHQKKSYAPQNQSALVKMRAAAYSVPIDKGRVPTGPAPTPRLPLGVTSVSSSASPGVTVGATYYDYQHNSSMGRMVGIGPHSGETGFGRVHFGWMYLPDSVLEYRSYAYNDFDSDPLQGPSPPVLFPDPEDYYSGYVNTGVSPDNRAVVGGHVLPLQGGQQRTMAQIHFEQGYKDFSFFVRVPDSSAYYVPDYAEAVWPKFFYQFGTDTVLHVAAKLYDMSNPTNYTPTSYFRIVDPENGGSWDYPPRVFDTTVSIAHDIAGSQAGDRVALAWLASLPYEEPGCDTCSGLSIYEGYLLGQMDNDVYIQISNDQGLNWEPRQNITSAGIGEAGFKAFSDLSILFDQADNFRIVWNEAPWPADTCVETGGFCFTGEFIEGSSRISHWSENMPYIRTVTDHTYPASDSCGPPAWGANVAKMSVSECDGKLYCIWSQFNDIPNGIDDDCAEWGYAGAMPSGAANADIWVTASGDGGLTWGLAQNLTNSYTPHCDPDIGYDCQSDYWASMTPYGRRNETGEDWTGAVVVDPSGGYPTDWHLDIQYLNDLEAGGVVQGEGGWTYSPIKWFRMPCFPVWYWTQLLFDPDHFGQPWFPVFAPPGTQMDTTLILENIGNTDANYMITIEEDNGPTGWLAVSDFSGTVPFGLLNADTGTVHVNYQGIVGDYMELSGRLIFEGNFSNSPVTIPVYARIGVPPPPPYWDTVHTNCLALICGSHSNTGRHGWGKVNMDYYPEDCDSTAIVYMYEGSTVLGRDGGNTFNYIMWGADYFDPTGLWAQGDHIPTTYCGAIQAEVFESGTIITPDSTIAMEKIWVAPQDDCDFVIEYLRVWSADGQTHDGLLLGEVIDWDVPWDYLPDEPDRFFVNTGHIDPTRNLVYQQGYESYLDDTLYPFNCQFNDDRFAGNAFVESRLNGAPRSTYAYSGFAGEFDRMSDPDQGFVHSLMWDQMILSGFTGSDSTEDLFTGLCFEPDLTLGPGDYYEVITILATVHEGTLTDLRNAVDEAKYVWLANNGGMSLFEDLNDDGQIDICESCCTLRGDVNCDDQVDALDIICYVSWMWSIPPICEPCCDEHLDVDGDGYINALDIIYLVEYIFGGGPPPPPCP